MAYILGQESLSASPKDNALRGFFGDCCVDSLGLFFLLPFSLISSFCVSSFHPPSCLFAYLFLSWCLPVYHRLFLNLVCGPGCHPFLSAGVTGMGHYVQLGFSAVALAACSLLPCHLERNHRAWDGTAQASAYHGTQLPGHGCSRYTHRL